jgi:hypothetical protein
MRPSLSTLFLYATLALLTALDLAGSARAQVKDIGYRITNAGHGLVAVDRNGGYAPLTGRLVLLLQSDLQARLEAMAPPSAQDGYKRLQAQIAQAGTLSEGDNVVAGALRNAFLIDSIRKSDPSGVLLPDEMTFRSRNLWLLTSYGKLQRQLVSIDYLEKGALADGSGRDILWSKVQKIPALLDFFKLIPFPHFLYTYSAQCRAAGVPAPPNWDGNTDTTIPVGWVSPNGWRKQGVLNTNYLTPPGMFHNARTTVFSYVSTAPKGLCIALPIIQDAVGTPNVIDALGIICEGVSTTGSSSTSNAKACFWDNNGDVTLMTNTPYPIESNKFKAPPNLPDDNQCTDCHAGENAFITHPSTPIQTAKDQFNATGAPNFITGNNWYTPMVQATWPTNPEAKPYPSGNGLCSGCHTATGAGRLPNVNPFMLGGIPPRDNLYKFCYFLLPNVLTSTPAAGFNLGTMSAQNATTGASDIYNACKTLFPYFPMQAQWMQSVSPP